MRCGEGCPPPQKIFSNFDLQMATFGAFWGQICVFQLQTPESDSLEWLGLLQLLASCGAWPPCPLPEIRHCLYPFFPFHFPIPVLFPHIFFTNSGCSAKFIYTNWGKRWRSMDAQTRLFFQSSRTHHLKLNKSEWPLARRRQNHTREGSWAVSPLCRLP